MRTPELVAHRGWARGRPENTLGAVAAAIDAGARWVEIDVQLSRDGAPVLFHDRTLDRMCGVGGAVHERTLAELVALSAGEPGRFGDLFAGERVAGLSAFAGLLALHSQVRAFVEVKRVTIERFGVEAVLEAVRAAIEPVRDRCALISFSLPFLAHARSACALPLGAVVDRWAERERAEVRALDPEYLFCDVDGLPASGPVSAGRARIAVWEVDDPRAALDLAARGVDLVETFAVVEMLAALRGFRDDPAPEPR